MKKNLFTLFLCLLGMLGTIQAQNFEPGEEAKGYMDDENTSVDLSTGLFHYKIPLFVLSEGNFELPVSLSYMGKGVTVDHVPGQIGYNWTLQAGGVVTRVIRGGIADDASNGAMRRVATSVKEASLRKQDGEKDIFTVNFNNRTLNFVLSSNYKVYQLEKSDVDISCLYDLDGIKGWQVIDENGVEYIYMETEVNENRSHESSVSFNNVADKMYVSSWFITNIVIPNADTIKFQYGARELSPPYDIQPNMEDRLITNISTQLYQYGRAMNEYIFNDTYMPQYRQAINSAISYMQQEHVSMQNELNQNNSRYVDNYFYWNNNVASFLNGKIQYHQRIMGLLTEVRSISGASVELAMYLDRLIDYCKSVGATMSASELKRAKSLFKLMCTRAKAINEKMVQMTSTYHIRTPILKRIITRDKDVVLAYRSETTETGSSHILQELNLRDADDKVLQRVKLTQNFEGCLKEVKSDFTGGGTHILSFSYYFEKTTPRGVDLWGQWTSISQKSLKEITRNDVDPEYIKRFSLSQIKFSTGMSIGIDYEPNLERVTPSTNTPSGGIRVKYITINKGRGSVENIVYEYPNGAKRVFGNISNREIVNYSGGIEGPFQDVVIKDRVTPREIACVCTGNNGVYYDRVVVARSGKGKQVYSFYVPSPTYSSSRFAFPHGLCGLLLGKASYDKNDYLVELVKNKYESGYAPSCIDQGFTSWFVPDNKLGIYERFTQVKPYEYCLDREKLEVDFRQESPVTTYADKEGSSVLLPYENIYEENIKPRVDVVLPEDNNYQLLYGGKTVLSEQIVYHLPDGANIPFSVNHVQSAPPSQAYVAKHTVYKYVNPRRVFPVQTVEYLSNGDTLVTVTRTPSDIASGVSPVLDRMRRHHVIAPVVKKQQFLKPKNSVKFYLLSEEINCFKDTVNPSGKLVFLEDGVYKRLKRECDSLTPSSISLDNTYFTHPLDAYRQEVSLRYAYAGGYFLPVEMIMPSITSVLCYDQGRGNVIMKVENTKRTCVDAIDALRVFDSPGVASSAKDGSLGKNLPTSLIVKPEQSIRQFRVHMLVNVNQSALQINYTLTQGNAITNENSGSIEVKAGEWTLISFDVNLVTGVDALEIFLPEGKVALATLVPVGTMFEAMSYDLEGKLFCKLNQNGQLERYEYGLFKKVKRVWDEKGNILYESYYNF